MPFDGVEHRWEPKPDAPRAPPKPILSPLVWFIVATATMGFALSAARGNTLARCLQAAASVVACELAVVCAVRLIEEFLWGP